MTDFLYTTLEAVKDDLSTGQNTPFTDDWDDMLTNVIHQASRTIDRLKRLESGAYKTEDQSADSIRYYFGSGTRWQSIDYLVSLTELAVEETDGTYTAWTEDTDFFSWPYNAADIDEPVRRFEVNVKSGTTKSYFTYGPKRIRVTGKFGISAMVPEEVERVALALTVRWWKRVGNAWADAGGGRDLGELRFVKEMDPEMKRVLMHTFPSNLQR